ncbi:hypothetical protein Tco_1128942 [Tanacetum coccineum]
MSVYTTTQNRKNHVVDSVLDSDGLQELLRKMPVIHDERVPKFMTTSCAMCGNFKHKCTCQPVDHMKECQEYLKKMFSKVETKPVEREPVEREPVERELVEQEPMEREHRAYEI